jgi:hypothetical protein
MPDIGQDGATQGRENCDIRQLIEVLILGNFTSCQLTPNQLRDLNIGM